MGRIATSKGCRKCRDVHVKCDEGKPECQRCVRIGVACPGYEDIKARMFRDETARISVRYQKGKLSKTSPAKNADHSHDHPLPLVADPDKAVQLLGDMLEDSDGFIASASDTMIKRQSVRECGRRLDLKLLQNPGFSLEYLCLQGFFNTWVLAARRDALTSRGHLDIMFTLYIKAPKRSPLRPAIMWLSTVMSSPIRYDPTGSQVLTSAVSSLRASLEDAADCQADDTLAAILALEYGSSILSRYYGMAPPDFHQRGALALIGKRGKSNVESKSARLLLTAVRGNAVDNAMRHGDVSHLEDAHLWSHDSELMPNNLRIKLDGLLVRFLTLRSRINKAMSRNTSSAEFDQLHQEARLLYLDAYEWQYIVPDSWHPNHSEIMLNNGHEYTLQRITTYATIYFGSTMNIWRSLCVGTIKLLHNTSQFTSGSFPFVQCVWSAKDVRTFFNDFCDAIPFLQGFTRMITAYDVRTSLCYDKLGCFFLLRDLEFLHVAWDLDPRNLMLKEDGEIFGPPPEQLKLIVGEYMKTRLDLLQCPPDHITSIGEECGISVGGQPVLKGIWGA